MTAIVAISQNNTVWIGGDSAGVNSSFGLTVRKDEKVFANNPFVFGFTTSFRMGQLLRYSFQPPLHNPLKYSTDESFMSVAFIDAVRECLKSGGFAAKENEKEEGGTFVVGYRGKIYYVYEDYQVGIPVDNFAAVGCGAQICLGSLCTSKGKPYTRIETALKAAERYSAGVRGPFKIMAMKYEKYEHHIVVI